MNRRPIAIAAVLLALAGGLAVVLSSSRSEDAAPERTDKPATTGVVFQAHAPQIKQQPRVLVSPSGFAVRFAPFGEAPNVPVDATVGMAGVYPAPRLSASTDATIPLPAAQASTLWLSLIHI